MIRWTMVVAAACAMVCVAGGAASARGATAIQSDHAPVEITLPDGWAKLPNTHTGKQDPTVALTAVNNESGLGCAVVFEPKHHLHLSLDAYAAAVLKQMAQRGTDVTHSDWAPAKVGANDALRCDLHLTRAKLKLAYVVTVFQTADSYDQVLAWSLESQFPANQAALIALSDGFHQTGPAPVAAPPTGGPVTVRSRDGTEEMVLPAGWEARTSTKRDTQLLATNADHDQFVQLISENRKDMTFNLREYADLIIGNMVKRGTDASHTDWQSIKAAGHDALRCDVRVTINHTKFAYVMTVLETPDRLEQVLAWTQADNFDAAKASLSGLADDLRSAKADH